MPDSIPQNLPESERNGIPELGQSDRDTHEQVAPLCSPAMIALLALMAGPHIALFPGWKILSRLGIGIGPRLLLVSAALLYPVLYVFLVFWPTDWYWSSLVLTGANLAAAVGFYLAFRRLYLARNEEYRSALAGSRIAQKRFVFTGIAGGGLLLPLLGIPFTIAFLLGVDRLFSTVMPIAFDDSLSLGLLSFGVLTLGLTGAVAGGWIGRLRLRISPAQLLAYGVGLVWIVLLWFLFLQLTIVLPGFLTMQIDSEELLSPFALFFVGNVLIGGWWSTSLLVYSLGPEDGVGKLCRFLLVPAVSLSSALILSLAFGYSSDWFHSAGKYLEKEGRTAASMWCYERGLSRKPSALHASYLQYRIALLAHRLGDSRKAMDGFRKVVSMYDAREDLVETSTRFLDNLERNGWAGNRVVLPGVENATAYKDSYCVPNSLALVMRYWGSAVDAEEIGEAITGLSRGTNIVDEAWFAEQNGFRHEFLPAAGLADIFASIDAGFPVLVYVPFHVFAIVGYDRNLETLVTYDVATSDIWVDYLQKDFVRSWKKEAATMVLVYPPEKADGLPDTIRTGLAASRGQYLQYQLHSLDSPDGSVGADHLRLAMQGSSDFFLPLVTAYTDYPALRSSLLGSGDVDRTVEGIVRYFGADFDEGTHLAGQTHDYDTADDDEKLESALRFLVGTGHLETASTLIEEIGAKGTLSDTTLQTQAMLDLSLGNFDNAVARLSELDNSQLSFYLAQTYLQQGNVTGAVAGLVKTVDGCT